MTVIAMAVTGCGSSGSSSNGSKAYTIGFAPYNQTQAIFVQVADYLKKTGAQDNAKVLVGDPNNDPTKQLQLIQTWLTTGLVNALFILPLDPNALDPVLEQAASKNIPVVITGTPKVTRKGQVVITSDWHQYGLQAGTGLAQCINQRLGGQAKVAILGGPDLPGDVVTGRIQGEKDALAQMAPAAQIVAEQNGQGARLQSLQVMSTILRAHPEINAVTGTNDDSMIGVVNAFQQAGKDPTKLCIVGLDATPEGLADVSSGTFYATVDLNYLAYASNGLKALTSMVRSTSSPYWSPPQTIVIPSVLKTRA